jgi:hypothetical protein
MDVARPSQTALAAAAHRAAHQVLEQGRIFADPLGLSILGDEAASAVQRARDEPETRRMRVFLAARSRFAEDTLGRPSSVVSVKSSSSVRAFTASRRNPRGHAFARVARTAAGVCD